MSKRFNFDPLRSVAEWQRQQRILHSSKNEPSVTTPSTAQTPADLARRTRERFTAGGYSAGLRRDGKYHYRGKRITKAIFDPY